MTHPYVSEYRESHLAEWRETDMAERITLEAPELRQCNQVAAVRTSTNILIGCAYRRPMPQLSADAERIQRALLRKPRQRRRFSDGLLFWLTLIGCGTVFVLLSGCGPSDLDALRADALSLQDAKAAAVIAASARK